MFARPYLCKRPRHMKLLIFPLPAIFLKEGLSPEKGLIQTMDGQRYIFFFLINPFSNLGKLGFMTYPPSGLPPIVDSIYG